MDKYSNSALPTKRRMRKFWVATFDFYGSQQFNVPHTFWRPCIPIQMYIKVAEYANSDPFYLSLRKVRLSFIHTYTSTYVEQNLFNREQTLFNRVRNFSGE